MTSKKESTKKLHSSFKVTKRRDAVATLNLPKYMAFTKELNSLLWKNKKIFFGLVITYSLLSVIFLGLSNQDVFNSLSDLMKTSSGDLFNGGALFLVQNGLLAVGSIGMGVGSSLSETQQLLAVLFAIILLLATVWIFRNIMAGAKVKLRDALYNSPTPLVSAILVSLLLAVQMLPLAMAIVGYSAASVSGLLNSGVEAMLFWVVIILLATLSVYWMSSTLFALVIVTLPGTYPVQAIVAANDLVRGRRLKIIYRLLWMCFMVVIGWMVVFLPLVALDSWLIETFSAFRGVPIIPVTSLLMSTATVVWATAFIYFLYRKIVDDSLK